MLQAHSIARPVLKSEKRQAANAALLERAHPGSGQLHGPVVAPEPKLASKSLAKDGSIIKVLIFSCLSLLLSLQCVAYCVMLAEFVCASKNGLTSAVVSRAKIGHTAA